MGSRSLVCLIFGLAIWLVGFTFPDRPQFHVNDFAHVLDAGSFARLEARFSNFEKRTGRQAVVAIFTTIDEESIDTLTTRIFEKWRLGSKKENDGVLLVLAMQEHRMRIEVGYGLEGQLPDALAGRIISQDLTPLLRKNQVAEAIGLYEGRLEQIIIEGNVPQYSQRGPKKVSPLTVVLLVVFFFVWLFSAWSASQNRRTIGANGASSSGGWWWVLWWLFGGGGGGRGGGWGDGGGGGWSGGGGGSSGGGGASGGW